MTDRQIKAEFVWGTDEQFGHTAWIMKGHPDFDAGDGRLCAHDTLEHFSDYHGMEGEMMAFGSMVLIRVEGGYFESNPFNPLAATHIGSDIARFLQEMKWDSEKQPSECPHDPKSTDADYVISDSMSEGIYGFIEEAKSGDNEIDEAAEEAWAEQMCDKLAAWMRYGYVRAQARWEGNRPEELTQLFTNLMKDIDSKSKHVEQGEEMWIDVDCETLSVKLRIVHSYDEEHPGYEPPEENEDEYEAEREYEDDLIEA